MFQLTRYATDAAAAIAEQNQWPVRFVALNTADDSPAKIFVMKAASDDLFSASFSCVASATQMTDLPVDAPNESGPFYRVHDVTMLCRSAEAATEFIDKVKYTVQDLADNLQAADVLAEEEEIIIEPQNVI